ncbi:MAG: 50S ribosomal protein L1 [Verrucomicrobia bacterium]|nr:50S ribosomal protein L1 [Verrucomicrobiota bacterium]
MSRLTKRNREIASKVDKSKLYTFDEAIELLKAAAPVKFDQTVEVVFKLGVDSRKSDQNVRGTVSLPKGTGKTLRVLVLAKGDKLKEALTAGADYAGSDELVEKIAAGWTEFDAVVATPDMMREVGKLGKVLGPRGLMPTPKAGTVTTDIAKAVQEIKAGKIEFKSDRYGIVNSYIGKLSFSLADLRTNFRSLANAVMRARPATVKGNYLERLYFSSTMGPGVKVDMRETETSAKG